MPDTATDLAAQEAATPSKYRETPWPTDKMPPGIPYIIGNEAAERFSYYGMTAILATFLTKYLLDSSGNLAVKTENEANEIIHFFIMGVYFFPIVGAVISDVVLGKYWTILLVSLLYCVGHAVMALVDAPQLTGIDPFALLCVALLLLSLGAGGIKPCVSSHVGDQFGPQNKHLIPKIFSWFYFSINFGAAFSTLLTPLLLDRQMFFDKLGGFGKWLDSIGISPGPSLAFGVPGVLMGLATIMFWLGRNKFVHIPPAGKEFWDETLSADGLSAARNLIPLFGLICIFFALFDQSHTSWIHQAAKMDRTLFAGTRFEMTPDPAQFQAVNPILVLILIPIFAYGIYPMLGRFFAVTPLRKIAIGMFLTVPSFALIAMAQEGIDREQGLKAPASAEVFAVSASSPNAAAVAGAMLGATASVPPPRTPIAWQLGAYVILTAAEIMVSITALEFAYTQAPRKMKSFVMGLYLLFGIALGNFFAAMVNGYIARRVEGGDRILQGADYFWFFTACMLVMAVVFAIYAMFYRGRTYIQGESPAA